MGPGGKGRGAHSPFGPVVLVRWGWGGGGANVLQASLVGSLTMRPRKDDTETSRDCDILWLIAPRWVG